MKTKRRHELQTNQLADSLAHAIEVVKPYTRVIFGLLLAVVVLGCTYAYLSAQASGKQDRAWDDYIEATTRNPLSMGMELDRKKLDDLIEKSKGTHAAEWARLTLADAELVQGTEQLFSDKSDATSTLQQAVSLYEEAVQDAHDPLLRQGALFGMARANEALGELDKAEKEYEQLLTEFPNSAYAVEAKRREEDLKKNSTKEFYDWLAKYEPEKRASKQPGKPGERLDFSDKALDKELNLDDLGRKFPFSTDRKEPAADAESKKPDDEAKATDGKGDSSDEKPAAPQKEGEKDDQAAPQEKADQPQEKPAPPKPDAPAEKPDSAKPDGGKDTSKKAKE
jgi:tetratricopeptide (TPR) repeat protein